MFRRLKQDKCQKHAFVSDTKSNFLFCRGFLFSHAKNCPLGGMEKGQKVILHYPNFRHIRAARLKVTVQFERRFRLMEHISVIS